MDHHRHQRPLNPEFIEPRYIPLRPPPPSRPFSDNPSFFPSPHRHLPPPAFPAPPPPPHRPLPPIFHHAPPPPPPSFPLHHQPRRQELSFPNSPHRRYHQQNRRQLLPVDGDPSLLPRPFDFPPSPTPSVPSHRGGAVFDDDRHRFRLPEPPRVLPPDARVMSNNGADGLGLEWGHRGSVHRAVNLDRGPSPGPFVEVDDDRFRRESDVLRNPPRFREDVNLEPPCIRLSPDEFRNWRDDQRIVGNLERADRRIMGTLERDDRRITGNHRDDRRIMGILERDDRRIADELERADRRIVNDLERDDRRIVGNVERDDRHDYLHHEQYHPEVLLGEFELNPDGNESMRGPVINEVPSRGSRDDFMLDGTMNVRRGVQPPLRDKSRSPVKLWNRVVNVDDGFYEQGMNHGLELGKYPDRGRRQEVQEYNTHRTPRKNLQKKSAFLRIQPLKHTSSRNRYDTTLSPHKHKESLEYLDNRLSLERGGSPVDLDVSFKSNALVAKAIIGNPSSSLIDPNANSAVSDLDIRIGSENPSKTEGVKDIGNNSFLLKKEEKHSVNKVRTSPIKKRVGLPSQVEVRPNDSESSSSGSSSLSGGSIRRGSLTGQIPDKDDASAHSEKQPLLNLRKKRKSRLSGSVAATMDAKHVNVDSSGNQASSSCNNCMKGSEEGLYSSGQVIEPSDTKILEDTGKIDVNESPNRVEREVIDHSICEEPFPKKMRKRGAVGSIPDSVTPRVAEGPKNSNACAIGVQRTSNSDENLSKSVEKCNYNIGTEYDTRKDQDMFPLLSDHGSVEGSSELVACLGRNVDRNDVHSGNVDACNSASVVISNLSPVDVSNKKQDKVDSTCILDNAVNPCGPQVILSPERVTVEQCCESLQLDSGVNQPNLRNSEEFAILGNLSNNGVHSYKKKIAFSADGVDFEKVIVPEINETNDFQEQECQGAGATLVIDEPREGFSKVIDSMGCDLTLSSLGGDISLLNKKRKGTSKVDSLDSGISEFVCGSVGIFVKDSDLPMEKMSSAVMGSPYFPESDVSYRNELVENCLDAMSSMNYSHCCKKQKTIPRKSDPPDALAPENLDILSAADTLTSMFNSTQSAEQIGVPKSIPPGKYGMSGAASSALTTCGFPDSLKTDLQYGVPCLSVKGITNAGDKHSSLLSESGCKQNKDVSLMMTEAGGENGLVALESEGRMAANDRNDGAYCMGLDLSRDSDSGLVVADLSSQNNVAFIGMLPSASDHPQFCNESKHDGVATDFNMLDAQPNVVSLGAGNVVSLGAGCLVDPTLDASDSVPAVSATSKEKHGMDDKQPSEHSVIYGSMSFKSNSLLASNKMDLNASSSASADDKSFPQKILTVPSKNSKNTKFSSNGMSRNVIRRNVLTCANVSLSSNRASSVIASSTKAPSTYSSRPRTWHRSDIHPTSNAVVKKPFVGTALRRPPSDKTINVKGTSYIRKGNSLVRNPASGAATLGHCAFGSSINQSKPNETNRIGEMCSSGMVDSTIVHDCLSTGGSNTLIEMPSTHPLPCSDKASNHGVAYCGDCRSSQPVDQYKGKDDEELLKSTDNKLNIPGNPETVGNRNLEDVGALSDGNLPASCAKRIVYIKHKSNQLIAASNSVDSVRNMDRTLTFASDNSYFKKRKNQLIRASSESNIQQMVAVIDESSNLHPQRDSSGYSGRSSTKRLSNRVKPRKVSLVWKLCDKKSSGKDVDLLGRGEMLSHLLPWKRPSYWRSVWRSSAHISNSSLLMKNRKLLSTKKRAIIYVRSGRGFSLRRSKVISVAGASLKWSKSMERRSKKVNEETAAAVAAMDSAERQKMGASSASGAGSRNLSTDKPGERVFRIGAFRYRMDPSRRTLQRIPDEEPLDSVVSKPAKDVRRTYVPKRLLIGTDEYVRIGNGNQLVRDPKKRTRILASEKIRWSVHTARMRLARKRKFCQFFTRFGKCNKTEGKCPFIHDPSKIAICTKFLNGLCGDPNCKLTHKVIPERMPDCSFFLQGLCSNEKCPYRHVNVNPRASICESFLRGYCAAGDECQKKHRYICPEFEATGSCPQGSKCKLYHPKKGKGKKRKTLRDQTNSRGRYFGSGFTITAEPETAMAENYVAAKDGLPFQGGDLGDYISLEVSVDIEAEENNDPINETMPLPECEGFSSQLDGLDELIKPLRLLDKH